MKYQVLFSLKNTNKKMKMSSSAVVRVNSYLTALGNFVCVEVLQPSQPNVVMLSVVSLPNNTFTG